MSIQTNRNLITALKRIVGESENESKNESNSLKTLAQLKQKTPKLIEAVQKIYDNWDQSDKEYGDWQVGHGGICHLIVDAMLDVLNDFDCLSFSLDTEVHVIGIVKLKEGIFSIDIPHGIYEKGGGYTWTKIPEVIFEPNDLIIDKLSSDPEEFSNYETY